MQVPERRADKRIEVRLDKVFPVTVCSEVFGDAPGVARNISMSGMMIELIDPLPLGSFVTIRFEIPDSHGEIAARAEVKHHYCLNFATGAELSASRGIGLRFVEFIEDSASRWQETFRRHRVLH